jgi:phosphohistidine swiveling domain-containing protein
METTKELKPQFENKESFYKKAFVISNENGLYLRSYNTIVAKINGGVAVVFGLYSATTTRHIKEFLRQHNFKVENSEQILKDYKAVTV